MLTNPGNEYMRGVRTEDLEYSLHGFVSINNAHKSMQCLIDTEKNSL
jgi:hypothetical protein